MTLLNVMGWGAAILLWVAVFLRMIYTIRANRAAHQQPTLRRRNTGGRRRNRTNRKRHP